MIYCTSLHLSKPERIPKLITWIFYQIHFYIARKKYKKVNYLFIIFAFYTKTVIIILSTS
jgi:hypothetical protein